MRLVITVGILLVIWNINTEMWILAGEFLRYFFLSVITCKFDFSIMIISIIYLKSLKQVVNMFAVDFFAFV